ncbi:hypothetical protein HAX54_049506 [Datura stramonium]|uniref:Uncharacterized protein n=1 Tax=Datura stramonium TaxID=4076 RepID=A0ABS8RRF4_DATST|nr:hypothetical protein [Datura stramonium]
MASFRAVVGRPQVFETDRVNDEHVKRCNLLDFIWVPTDLVKNLTESGVDPLKLSRLFSLLILEFFDPPKFSGAEDVALYLLTNPYHSDRDFATRLLNMWRTRIWEEPKMVGLLWPTEFMTEDNSYPLPVDSMSEVT